MIVDSMTYKEFMTLYAAEGKLVEHKIKEGQKKFFHSIRNCRNTSRLYYKPVEFDSQRGFHHVIQFFNEGNTKPTQQRLGQYYYAYYLQKKGLYVIMISLAEKTYYHFNLYTPHFFDRYRERCLKDLTISKTETINTFFRKNPKVISMKQKLPSEKYPNDYWSICSEGLCLCNFIEGFVIEMKTFISKDMLGKDQWEFIKSGQIQSLERGYEMNFPDEDFSE